VTAKRVATLEALSGGWALGDRRRRLRKEFAGKRAHPKDVAADVS
jgi:hypothetical protein